MLKEERIARSKMFDSAKRMLMSKFNWDEDRAYQWLVRTAMDLRKTKYEVAEGVIEHLGSDINAQ